MLEGKIKKLEQILEKPYVKEQERPYYLHAIMIHDGVAENGHYYSYIYDRFQKVWWKLDDHRVSQANVEDVMKEALGGDGYKSACNLFYMSRHIADIIDKNRFSVFADQRARSVRIPASIQTEISRKNADFTLKT